VTVRIFCNLCGGEIEGQVVKVAAYSKPVSTDPDRFLQGEDGTNELGTAFAHPDCAERLNVGIIEVFKDTSDALSKPPEEGSAEQGRPPKAKPGTATKQASKKKGGKK
jgi:hypothetical protein